MSSTMMEVTAEENLVARYRKRPIEIVAFRYDKHGNRRGGPLWFQDALQSGKIMEHEPGILTIADGKAGIAAWHGDWIIRGIEGEIYPCPHSVFIASYDMIKG